MILVVGIAPILSLVESFEKHFLSLKFVINLKDYLLKINSFIPNLTY
jgi:hypothetical protein